MSATTFFRGQLVYPDRIAPGILVIRDEIIQEIWPYNKLIPQAETLVDVPEGFITPGFVDLHVHGGAGADFMDGTADAFRTALRCHARHGTTSMAVTTTVATHAQILATLEQTRAFRMNSEPNAARVLGAHFYGPYFRYEARGAHPGGPIRPAIEREFSEYLNFAADLVTATVAPEIEGAREFALACRAKGVRTNVGHSWATFAQMQEAIGWGVRHVDHLFCAMSDKGRLRQFQLYPMQGGVLEATLYFDELTTEVIADGKHLDSSLLLLALKIKGADRLALVTDTSRALDMPDGNYVIGPLQGGEPLIKRDNVGLMPDGTALASSCVGMDYMIRTFAKLTDRPLWEVIRMATLTPARIAGYDHQLGSLTAQKRADLVILDTKLYVAQTYIGGCRVEF